MSLVNMPLVSHVLRIDVNVFMLLDPHLLMFTGQRAGLWAVIPFQLIVMVGLGMHKSAEISPCCILIQPVLMPL